MIRVNIRMGVGLQGQGTEKSRMDPSLVAHNHMPALARTSYLSVLTLHRTISHPESQKENILKDFIIGKSSFFKTHTSVYIG